MENQASLNTSVTGSSETPQPKPRLMKRSWVLALHRRMSAIYMTKFTSSFPDTETVDDWCNVWAEHMADLTGEQLRYGLDRVAKECEWPPSLVEFRQLCEAAPKPPQARLAPPVFARTEFAD